MKYPYFTSSYYIRGFFGEHRWLSNFHLAPFSGLMMRDGVTEQLTFPSVENFYQYRKLLFADPGHKLILQACLSCSPAESKKLGQQADLGPKQIHWDTVKRLTVMEEGVRNKFRQNPDLRDKLLATDGKHLEESNSWGDKFWGVSCIPDSRGDLSILGDRWRKIGGKNMLGHILMKTRAQLFLENF